MYQSYSRVSKFSRSFVLAAAAVLLAGLPAVTFAQLEEIVVTAQKRAENLQDVPISVAVVSKEMLEQNFFEGLTDIEDFAPSVLLACTVEAIHLLLVRESEGLVQRRLVRV